GSSGENGVAATIHDSMGLPAAPTGSPVRLVSIRYPEGFEPACKQPTSLDAYWGASGGWYLSYGSTDGWGRTHPRTRRGAELPERVHKPLRALNPMFHSLPIGLVGDFSEDRDYLLTSISERFQRF